MAEAAQFTVHDFSTNFLIDTSKPKPHHFANMPCPQRARGRFFTKAKLALPHILILFVGLAHIIITLTAASAGLQGFSGIVKHSLDEATLELQAQSSLKWQEDLLYRRLDGLLHAQLSISAMETHEQCLIRGLEVANHELFGLGFQYEDIRNQTIDWTIENCGRLHYTLQADQSSAEQAVLTAWAKTTCRLRRVAEMTLWKIAEKTIVFQSLLFQKTGVRFLKHPEKVDNHQSSSATMVPEQARMPFGFDLQCAESNGSCLLVFKIAKSAHFKKATLSHEAIADRKRKIQDLFKSHHHLDALRRTTTLLASSLMPLELLCLVAYLVTMLADVEYPVPFRSWRNALSSDWYLTYRPFTNQEKGAAVYIIVQLVAMMARVLVEKTSHGGRAMVLNIAVLMTTASVSALIQAFVPITDITCVPHMFGAIKQIYLIAQQPDVLSIRVVTPLDWKSIDNKIKEFINKPSEDKTALSKLSPPANSLEAPRLSPRPLISHATPEEEPHNEMQPDRNVWVDSDYETESDGKDYIDLAGGITSTTTEDAEWSMVDA